MDPDNYEFETTKYIKHTSNLENEEANTENTRNDVLYQFVEELNNENPIALPDELISKLRAQWYNYLIENGNTETDPMELYKNLEKFWKKEFKDKDKFDIEEEKEEEDIMKEIKSIRQYMEESERKQKDKTKLINLLLLMLANNM